MSRTRSHRPDLNDASAQSDLICEPQPIIIDQTQAAQIGGYARKLSRRLGYELLISRTLQRRIFTVGIWATSFWPEVVYSSNWRDICFPNLA